MARLYGLNGALRGKQGNNVFSIQHGTQIVKAYQPVVANPRTDLQMEQRAKFALTGKMSGATPIMALSGIAGGSARAKRARFVQMLLRHAVTQQDSDTLIASIPFNEVIYSEGSTPKWYNGQTVTVGWEASAADYGNLRVFVQRGTPSTGTPASYSELRVVATYDAKTSQLEAVQVQEMNAAGANEFRFHEYGRVDTVVAVYIVPFLRRTSASRPISSDVYPTEESVALDMSERRLITDADFGRSVFIGTYSLESSRDDAAVPRDDAAVPMTGAAKKSAKK